MAMKNSGHVSAFSCYMGNPGSSLLHTLEFSTHVSTYSDTPVYVFGLQLLDECSCCDCLETSCFLRLALSAFVSILFRRTLILPNFNAEIFLTAVIQFSPTVYVDNVHHGRNA